MSIPLRPESNVEGRLKSLAILSWKFTPARTLASEEFSLVKASATTDFNLLKSTEWPEKLILGRTGFLTEVGMTSLFLPRVDMFDKVSFQNHKLKLGFEPVFYQKWLSKTLLLNSAEFSNHPKTLGT